MGAFSLTGNMTAGYFTMNPSANTFAGYAGYFSVDGSTGYVDCKNLYTQNGNIDTIAASIALRDLANSDRHTCVCLGWALAWPQAGDSIGTVHTMIYNQLLP